MESGTKPKNRANVKKDSSGEEYEEWRRNRKNSDAEWKKFVKEEKQLGRLIVVLFRVDYLWSIVDRTKTNLILNCVDKGANVF